MAAAPDCVPGAPPVPSVPMPLAPRGKIHPNAFSQFVKVNNNERAWELIREDFLSSDYYGARARVHATVGLENGKEVVDQVTLFCWAALNGPIRTAVVEALELIDMRGSYLRQIIFPGGRNNSNVMPAKYFNLNSFTDPFYNIRHEQGQQPMTTATPTTQIPALPFETKHFIYGKDINLLADAELVEAIKKVEVEVDSLKAVRTSSTKIKAKIAELETMLGEIVKVLDAR